jgi:uncharacterized protein
LYNDRIMKRKHVAYRTCVGCGKKRSQEELTRFIRSLRGTVSEDVFFNKEGRGAYICRDTKERCLVRAIQKNSFQRALPSR